MSDELVLDHPVYGTRTIADIVRDAAVGDRVHIELTHRDGEIPWRSEWVTDADDDWFETDRYRVEITDADAPGRGAVTLFENRNGEYVSTEFTDALNGLERTPAAQFDGVEWFEWEVHLRKSPGTSGEKREATVFPEAPTREDAENVARRWAAMAHADTPVVYREQQVEADDTLTA